MEVKLVYIQTFLDKGCRNSGKRIIIFSQKTLSSAGTEVGAMSCPTCARLPLSRGVPPSKPAPSQFYLLCPLPPSSPTCSQLCFLFPYLSTSLVGVCLQCGRPGLGRSPGEGNGNPLQYSCLENPMDGGAWWATVHGVAKSWTRLSGFTFTLSECPPASICPLSSCTF